MGQDYDPTWHFTVADLLSFNLGRYKDLIAAVCSGATAEYALEQQLERLIRGWQEKDFKLAKHIPLMRPRIERESKKSVKEKRKNIRPGQNSGVSDCCRSQASSDCFRFLDSFLSLSRHSIQRKQIPNLGNNRPSRLTPSCTQFKSPAVKILNLVYCICICFLPKGFELGTTLS